MVWLLSVTLQNLAFALAFLLPHSAYIKTFVGKEAFWPWENLDWTLKLQELPAWRLTNVILITRTAAAPLPAHVSQHPCYAQRARHPSLHPILCSSRVCVTVPGWMPRSGAHHCVMSQFCPACILMLEYLVWDLGSRDFSRGKVYASTCLQRVMNVSGNLVYLTVHCSTFFTVFWNQFWGGRKWILHVMYFCILLITHIETHTLGNSTNLY